MSSSIKNISIILLLTLTAIGVAACGSFQVPSSVGSALPLLVKNPPSTAEISFHQGEFKNSETTRVVDVRASWMVAVGRRSVSELQNGGENAERLNYERAYVGGKVSAPKWNIAVLGNDTRYRVEAELVLPVTDRLTKNLCGLFSAEIENEGTGADFVNDRIGLGLRYEF